MFRRLHKRIFITALFAGIFLSAAALAEEPEHAHNHGTDTHHHDAWELGLAVGAVALVNESEVALGLHLHALRALPWLNGWRLGVGAETVLDEHAHANLAVVINYELFGGLNASVAPGVLVVETEQGWTPKVAAHFELAWEFDLGGVHLGPVLEYAWSSIDQHAMVGLHVGLPL